MINFRNFFSRSEKYFQKGTKQQFWLHEILLISNLLLFSLALFEFYAEFNGIYIPHWIHMIEFIFGALFLFELIFHLIHVYIPNKVFFKPFLWLNAIVVVSLLYPAAFGNLAVLRLLRTTKILKVYLYNKKVKRDISRNPDLEMQSVKLAKAMGKGAQAVSTGTEKAITQGAQAVGKGMQSAGKSVEAARERIFVKKWKAEKRYKHNHPEEREKEDK